MWYYPITIPLSQPFAVLEKKRSEQEKKKTKHAIIDMFHSHCQHLTFFVFSFVATVLDSSDTSWADGDELVSEDRFHALRMLNGVAEG